MTRKHLALAGALALGTLFTACDKSSSSSVTASTASGVYVTGDTTVHTAHQNNFRDLGGYVGANGKRILFGKLFRSGALSSLNAADRDTLTARGIQQVIDLRRQGRCK